MLANYFIEMSNLPEREKWILRRVILFFQNHDNLQKFLKITQNTTRKKISLRLIDWFITNYCKKNYIVYQIKRDNLLNPQQPHIELFSPYLKYKEYLSAYPKKLFDPFCRGNGILLDCRMLDLPFLNSPDEPPIESFETAVCQLHFFKWAIENEIIDYIENHLEEIYEDMQTHCTRASTKKGGAPAPPRQGERPSP